MFHQRVNSAPEFISPYPSRQMTSLLTGVQLFCWDLFKPRQIQTPGERYHQCTCCSHRVTTVRTFRTILPQVVTSTRRKHGMSACNPRMQQFIYGISDFMRSHMGNRPNFLPNSPMGFGYKQPRRDTCMQDLWRYSVNWRKAGVLLWPKREQIFAHPATPSAASRVQCYH